jgi:hypothetical protein
MSALLTAATLEAAPIFPTAVPGLRLRMEADYGVTTSGNFVTAWADQSGNGFNATQGTAAKQPTLTAGNVSANGLYPAIRFDGIKDITTGDSLASTAQLQSPISAGTTFFVVYSAESNGAEQLPFLFGQAGGIGNLRSFYMGTSDGLGFAGWGAGDKVSTFHIPFSTDRIASFTLNDTRNQLSILDRTTGDAGRISESCKKAGLQLSLRAKGGHGMANCNSRT